MPSNEIATATKFARASNFDTTDFFKVGDELSVGWTIRKKLVWWKAKIIKAKNIGRDFGKPCRIYVLKYEPRQFYPRGKIMEHCFLDENRLFDLEGRQLVTYYTD